MVRQQSSALDDALDNDTMNSPDRGATSLVVIVLTGVTMVMMFAAVQAALWTHARAEARAVAREAAVMIARQGISPVEVAGGINYAFTDIPDGEGDTGVSDLLSNPWAQIELCDTTTSSSPADDGVVEIVAHCREPYGPEAPYVTVTITGVVPGIVRGTGFDVTVVEKVAIEGFRK